jgi:hypothetical protein
MGHSEQISCPDRDEFRLAPPLAEPPEAAVSKGRDLINLSHTKMTLEGLDVARDAEPARNAGMSLNLGARLAIFRKALAAHAGLVGEHCRHHHPAAGRLDRQRGEQGQDCRRLPDGVGAEHRSEDKVVGFIATSE